jgi:hypothetical protein
MLYVSKTKRLLLEEIFVFNFYSSSPTAHIFSDMHFKDTVEDDTTFLYKKKKKKLGPAEDKTSVS